MINEIILFFFSVYLFTPFMLWLLTYKEFDEPFIAKYFKDSWWVIAINLFYFASVTL